MAGQRGVARPRGNGGEGFQGGVPTLDVRRVVDVVVELHRLLVDGGLQRVVLVRQRRQDELGMLETDLAFLHVGGFGSRRGDERRRSGEDGGPKTEVAEGLATWDGSHKGRLGDVLGCYGRQECLTSWSENVGAQPLPAHAPS